MPTVARADLWRAIGACMPSHVDELVERMAAPEREVHAELNRARKEWRYRIEACLRAGASSTMPI